ncbi:uncharacterized protein [Littorina saxatilis]|uniref:Uncharacterized protein n=1 Tax=Littorina saxatilis TaxID=31220 RepID=A0AAN9AKU1_9CAEN
MADRETQESSNASLKLLEMVDTVKSYYPNILTRTYVVPPVHFNRVPYEAVTVPGTNQSALVQLCHVNPKGVIQADFAQQHVLFNLQELGQTRSEVMFVVSELNFKHYLNKKVHQSTTKTLPKPATLPDTARDHGVQGDFDILVIHRHHGILVGEMKSVGWNEASVSDKKVTKVLFKAMEQLDKCEVHARHMVSDVAPGLTVRKALILPYVSGDQLRKVLESNEELQQAVCRTLDAPSVTEAVQLCCCSDHLSDPAAFWEVTGHVMSRLTSWWRHRMACVVDPQLTDQLYLVIVARFVGPATTVSIHWSVSSCFNAKQKVEVRTEGEAVAELSRRLEPLVLTPQQIGLMAKNPALVCLTGPPGTGKTVMMELQGLRWLLEGRDVHVLTTARASTAISIGIAHQLNVMLNQHPHPAHTSGTVCRHQYDFTKAEDVARAVTELSACARDGQLYILMDEANFTVSTAEGQRNRRLLKELADRFPGLHLWAARIGHRDVPSDLVRVELTLPLRSAPVIQRLVQLAREELTHFSQYSNNGVPSPGDGLSVIRLSHHGDAHTGRWPVDCELCGHNVAAELRRLRVGATERMMITSPAPLRYGDVFVLTRSVDLHDHSYNRHGWLRTASHFVLGLRAERLPVCVLGRPDVRHSWERWERDVADVAVGKTDSVTVAYWEHVQGLERPLVVLLPGRRGGRDEGTSEERIVAEDRLMAVSRARSQLIVVEVPR